MSESIAISPMSQHRLVAIITLWPCSLAIVVESCHITICYTIGVYMVHHFLENSANESQIGTLTGLLVRAFITPHLA